MTDHIRACAGIDCSASRRSVVEIQCIPVIVGFQILPSIKMHLKSVAAPLPQLWLRDYRSPEIRTSFQGFCGGPISECCGVDIIADRRLSPWKQKLERR